MKKKWINPMIYSNSVIGDGDDEWTWDPEGSGQSTPNPDQPDASWSYEDWLEIYKDFPDVLGSGSWEEYVAWYQSWFNETPTRP